MKTLIYTTIVLLSLCMLAAAPPSANLGASSKADGPLLREAQRALEVEDYAQAETLLSEAMKQMPGEASLPYNLGVARFRRGDFKGAGEAFARAAELANDPDLRARSVFNQGTSTYAQALDRLKQGEDVTSLEQPLDQTIDLVGNSLEQLKQAIEANPVDRDARANAELAHRLLRQLEEIQQQMQQQQQEQQEQQQSRNEEQQQDEQQESSPQQDEEQHQQQQQQEQQQREEQQSGEQPEQQQQQQQNQQQPSEQPQEQQQSSEQQQSEQQQSQQQQAEQSGEQAEQQRQEQQQRAGAQPEEVEREEQEGEREADAQPPGEAQLRDGQMTREQAERLLQLVRDKQRERRAALAEQRERSRQPAAKDW